MADCYISNADQQRCNRCNCFVSLNADGRYLCSRCNYPGFVYTAKQVAKSD